MTLQGKDDFLDPYKDLIWMLMSGSSGPVAGGMAWWRRKMVLSHTAGVGFT